MGQPIATLRDDFEDNLIAAAWTSIVAGSATVTEAAGRASLTLPSSTAGSHTAYYRSTSTYDLTGDGCSININAMVATGVAATMTFDLLIVGSGNNVLRWQQVSNTITARKIVAGVDTQLYTATWSATTYKYLRIRESSGTIYFDSSTNGTSWTNRATIVGLPFAITDLSVQFGASCGNVASPGALKIEDFNLILPALTTNWRWTQVVWPLSERFKVVTLALDTAGTAQAYIAFADAVDVNNDPVSPTYWSGPADGGRELASQATQAAAAAMAVNIPLDGRFDLPSMAQGRVVRVYHRSIDGANYTLREVYPRRLVQSDDIEAESIKAINIAASAVTVDKLDATLTITGKSIQTDYTGARVVLSGDTHGGLIGYGASDTYDPATGSGTYQILWSEADGKFYAGTGNVILDASGIGINAPTSSTYDSTRSIDWFDSTPNRILSIRGYYAGGINLLEIEALSAGSRPGEISIDANGTRNASLVLQGASSISQAILVADLVSILNSDSTHGIDFYTNKTIPGGTPDGGFGAGGFYTNVAANLDRINLGTASGATTGQIISVIQDSDTSNVVTLTNLAHYSTATPAAGFGASQVVTLHSNTNAARGAYTVETTWASATDASRKARTRLIIRDTTDREAIRMEASGSAAMLGFFGAAAVARQNVTGTRTGTLAQLQTVMANLLTALANLGAITDSTT